MRLLSKKLLFVARPFQGRGVSVYAGVGPSAGVDPGPSCIKFRNLRLIGPGLHLRGHTWSIHDGVTKTARIAHVDDPTTNVTFAQPAEWTDRVVYVQLRTHWNDVENTSNADPYRLNFDNAGDVENKIHGTGKILSNQKRVGGIYRLRCLYTPASHGVQPTLILIRKSAGAGSLADVTVDAEIGQRLYTIDTAALTDGETYTFQLYAKNEGIESLLDSITFDADAVGPPAPTALSLEAV